MNIFDNGNYNNGNGGFYPDMTQNSNPIPIFSIHEIKRMARLKLRGKQKSYILPVLIIIAMLIVPYAVTSFYNLSVLPDTVAQYSAIVDVPDTLTNICNAVSPLALSGKPLVILLNLSRLLSLFSLIFTGAICLSRSGITLAILRDEKIEASSAFLGFGRILETFLTFLLVYIFSFLWSLLFLIPGTLIFNIAALSGSTFAIVLGTILFILCAVAAFIFLMRYEMVYFILADNPNMRVRDVVRLSVSMMRGKMINYVGLTLSFIPWFLLLFIPVALLFICISCAFACTSVILRLLLIIVSFALFAVAVGLYIWIFTYQNTAYAVFYSGASGNFRSTASANDENIINVTLNLDTRSIDIQKGVSAENPSQSSLSNSAENPLQSSLSNSAENPLQSSLSNSAENPSQSSLDNLTENNSQSSLDCSVGDTSQSSSDNSFGSSSDNSND